MLEACEWGYDGQHRYAHGGMFQAAIFIRKELERSRILSKLFGSNNNPTSNSTNTNTGNTTTPLTAVSDPIL